MFRISAKRVQSVAKAKIEKECLAIRLGVELGFQSVPSWTPIHDTDGSSCIGVDGAAQREQWVAHTMEFSLTTV